MSVVFIIALYTVRTKKIHYCDSRLMQTVVLMEQVLFCTDNFSTLIRIHTYPHYHRVMYMSVVIVDSQFLSDNAVNYAKSVPHYQDLRYH